MQMDEAIRRFPEQLKFKPVVENEGNLSKAKKIILCGMGGSHLAADLLKTWKPSLDLAVWHNYGLPEISDGLENCLVIISSYSGNTEEALDSFERAAKKNLRVACISVGGKLLELAKSRKVPYIQLPDTGIEPRSAFGFSLISLLKLLGEDKIISDIAKTADELDVESLRKKGEALAKKLGNFIPIIYASGKNEPIASNWKIRFNETGKIPSFYNTLPELNHNEMVGFDGGEKTKNLVNRFYFIFLRDKTDHPRVGLRMEILKNIFSEKGFPVEIVEFEGKNIWGKIFSSLMLADWTAYYTASQYGLNPKEVEIVEKFKAMLKNK